MNYCNTTSKHREIPKRANYEETTDDEDHSIDPPSPQHNTEQQKSTTIPKLYILSKVKEHRLEEPTQEHGTFIRS